MIKKFLGALFCVPLSIGFFSFVNSQNEKYINGNHMDTLALKNQSVQNQLQFESNVFRYFDNIKFNISPLGKAVNLAKGSVDTTSSNFVNLGEYVFDPNWMSSLYNEAVSETIYQSIDIHHEYSFGSDTSKYIQSFISNVETSSNVKASYSVYKASAQTDSSFSNEMKSSSVVSNIFCQDKAKIDVFRIDLPKAGSSSLYSSHLSSEFASALDDVYSKKISWDHLFDTYGTHILTSATYGGYCNIDLCISSSKKYFDSNTAQNVKTIISGSGFYDGFQMEGTAQIKTSFEHALGLSTDNFDLRISQHFVGGSIEHSDFINSPELIIPTINDWKNHLLERVQLVKMNKVYPIWNFIPQFYPESFALEAAAAYDVYSPTEEDDFVQRNDFSSSMVILNQTQEKTFECGINGINRKDYKKTINLIDNDELPNLNILKNCGFKTISILVTFEGRKEWGNIGSKQYLSASWTSIYDSNYNIMNRDKWEYGVDSVNYVNHRSDKNGSVFKTLTIDEALEHESLTLKFSTNNGDWICGRKARVRNLKIRFTYSQN